MSDTSERVVAVDGKLLTDWLKFHISDFGRLADSHRKMEDIRRYNECIEQQLTYEHYLRVVESGRFALKPEASQETKWEKLKEMIAVRIDSCKDDVQAHGVLLEVHDLIAELEDAE